MKTLTRFLGFLTGAALCWVAYAACVLVSHAQTLTITAPASLRSGQSGPVRLMYQDAPGAPVVAFQWSPGMVGAGTLTGPVVGSAATAAGKTELQCAPATLPTGPNPLFPRCILNGPNSNVVAAGEIATQTLTIPPGTPPGTLTLNLSNLLAASPAATAVPIAAGPPAIVTILGDPADINGDGKIDSADYVIVWDRALGKAPCGNADQNGDGLCNILDIELVRARLGTSP